MHYNKYMKRRLIVLVIILLILAAFLALWEYTSAPIGLVIMTGDECTEKGGIIVNTLGEKTWNDEDVIGEIDGMRCPCLCIKK